MPRSVRCSFLGRSSYVAIVDRRTNWPHQRVIGSPAYRWLPEHADKPLERGEERAHTTTDRSTTPTLAELQQTTSGATGER